MLKDELNVRSICSAAVGRPPHRTAPCFVQIFIVGGVHLYYFARLSSSTPLPCTSLTVLDLSAVIVPNSCTCIVVVVVSDCTWLFDRRHRTDWCSDNRTKTKTWKNVQFPSSPRSTWRWIIRIFVNWPCVSNLSSLFMRSGSAVEQWSDNEGVTTIK